MRLCGKRVVLGGKIFLLDDLLDHFIRVLAKRFELRAHMRVVLKGEKPPDRLQNNFGIIVLQKFNQDRNDGRGSHSADRRHGLAPHLCRFIALGNALEEGDVFLSLGLSQGFDRPEPHFSIAV